MSLPYESAIVIGRWQLPHYGHKELVQTACRLAPHVIIIVGSADQPSTPKNPFSVEERSHMMRLLLEDEMKTTDIEFVGVRDYLYSNDRWLNEIDQKVYPLLRNVRTSTTVIVGHHKDESSGYLDMFPQFNYVESTNTTGLDATDLRNIFYSENAVFRNISDTTSSKVIDYLEFWRDSAGHRETFDRIVDKHIYDRGYAELAQQFARNDNATDAVVIQNGHILLIQRAVDKTWALPGGFLNTDETLLECAVRELYEETRIDLPIKVLQGSLKDPQGVRFDHPQRDSRGRIITTAFLFTLPINQGKLTKVRASDDAIDAKWFKLHEIPKMRSRMYADHAEIIHTMTAGL